jgi:hypothetical protein
MSDAGAKRRRWLWWLGGLGLVGLFLGYNLDVYKAGTDARACLLAPDAVVIAEQLSPRYGEIRRGEVVLIRLRRGERTQALARVLAGPEQEVRWERGRLLVDGEEVRLSGDPVQPVRGLSEGARGAIIEARERLAPGALPSGWRGPLGERAAKRGVKEDRPPAGLGLPERRLVVPRQRVYLVTGAEGGEGVVGLVAPQGDIVAAALAAWPRLE